MNPKNIIFYPDATRGVIRSIDTQDLKSAGITGLIVNTYHLMSEPGISVIKEIGGIKKFLNWPEATIISDSGGFQMLSMIYQNPQFGTVTDNGVIFQRSSKGEKKKIDFTPEKCIQMQFALRSDIMICLDDCPRPGASRADVERSVERTIQWAKRCKAEFLSQLSSLRTRGSTYIPKLFAVIQGENYPDLRKQCADGLKEIGFDGYGFGGWPLDDDKKLNKEILKYTAQQMPDELPKYALGVGNPEAIADCAQMGYTIFDCVLPTRDARHGRLYNFIADPSSIDPFLTRPLYTFLYINEEKYTRDDSPIATWCNCHTCQNYSRAYLHHLFSIEDSLAWRLATIHNLYMYSQLLSHLNTFLIKSIT